MSHVIPFPAAYPTRSTALDRAETALLLAVRWWVAERRKGDDPLPRLCEALQGEGAHDAAFSVDRLMEVIARTAIRPVEIHCPGCAGLSLDECQLLHAASLVQGGNGEMAERGLRACFLSSAGAEGAIGALEGIGELFVAARLLLRARRLPRLAMEARPGSAGQPTLH
jgi:hypothetical protein